MIAEVYPLRRMPRRFQVFDYDVPAGMVVERGMAVRMPFRTGQTLGFIARLKERSNVQRGLKALTEVVPALSLSQKELAWFEELAAGLALPVSTLLQAAIPTPPKRPRTKAYASPSVQPMMPEVHPSTQTIREKPGPFFVTLPHLREAALLLRDLCRNRTGAVQILTPNVQDAKRLFEHLGITDAIFLSGEEPPTARFQAWTAYRSKKDAVLVSTRLGSLWPHPHLAYICVVRAGHRNHKQANQNPRYDARQAAATLAQHTGAKLVSVDVAPRADTCLHTNILSGTAYPPPTIISTMVDPAIPAHPVLMPPTLEAIEETLTLGKHVVCIYNRKGVSHHLSCRDCHHTFACTECGGPLVVYERQLRCHRCARAESVPLSCPKCHGTDLLRRGFGNRAIAQALERLCPGYAVQIIEKEGGETPVAPILLVTQYYIESVFNAFAPPALGLVVDLDADALFFQPTFRATEEAVLAAYERRGLALASNAKFLLQTQNPIFFTRAFYDLVGLLKEDLDARRAYHHPPFRRSMRITYRGTSPQGALRLLIGEIRGKFPTVETHEEIHERPSAWSLTMPPAIAPDVLKFFANLDDRYIIDTNADGR